MAREHGTLSMYKGGCRCAPCAAENNAYQDEYRTRLRQGRPTTTLVDAAPVREHALALLDIGATRVQIRTAAPCSESFLRTLLTGIPGRGLAPTRRVTPGPARRILALSLEPSLLIADELVHTWSTVCGDGSRRRVLALYALGYAPAWQAEQIGMSKGGMSLLLSNPGRGITARYAVRLRALYDRVWNVRPEGPAADAARAAAAARGWVLLPADWDDDLIDLSETALHRALARVVEQMETADLARAYTDYRAHSGRSPITVAAASSYRHRLRTTGSSTWTTSTPTTATSSPPAPTSSAAAERSTSRSATSTTKSPSTRPNGGRTPNTRVRASASTTTPAPRPRPRPSPSVS